MKLLLALVAVTVALSLGCASAPEEPTSDDAGLGGEGLRVENVPFRVLLHTANSGVVTPGGRVIDDADSFAALWASCTGARLPAPKKPMIDWTTERVLCVAAGPRPSAGFGIHVTGIEKEAVRGGEDVTNVRFVETVPEPGSVSAQVVTHPVQLVAIARRDGAVRFVSVTR